MKTIKKGIKVLVLVFATLTAGILNAQELKNTELYATLKVKDSLLFNIGFNQCDISQVEKLTNENFEFYHDKGGIQNSKKSFILELMVDVGAVGRKRLFASLSSFSSNACSV